MHVLRLNKVTDVRTEPEKVNLHESLQEDFALCKKHFIEINKYSINPSRQQELKAKLLPAYMVSASKCVQINDSYAASQCITEHSGLYQVDIDFKDITLDDGKSFERVSQIIEIVKGLDCVYVAGASVRKGVKVIVAGAKSIPDHEQNWKACNELIQRHLENNGVFTDTDSAPKNIASKCYVFFPMHVNTQPVPYKPEILPEKQKEYQPKEPQRSANKWHVSPLDDYNERGIQDAKNLLTSHGWKQIGNTHQWIVTGKRAIC